MALKLRKAIVRNTGINALLCLVVSAGLGMLTGMQASGASGFGWLLVLAAGIGLFSGWRTSVNIKKGVLQAIPQALSYVRLRRDTRLNGNAIDWQTLDDYAAQLESRGFTRVGDFTVHPLSPHVVGVAACFNDQDATMLVEVQHIQVQGDFPGVSPIPGGVRFSIGSLVDGAFRVTTTDHTVAASNYLLRGEYDVVASYPGMGLLPLLDKHARLLATIRERTGKSASPGLTMTRYVQQVRESMDEARGRLEKMSGFAIAHLVDAFEAAPKSQWAPPTAQLAALPSRSIDSLDERVAAAGQALIIDAPQEDAGTEEPFAGADGMANERAGESIDEGAGAAASGMSAPRHDPEAAALRQRAESGANWFYWIAGLSLVNAVAGAMGSNWAFAIGLGISELAAGAASELRADAGSSFLFIAALYGIAFAAAGFFAACGWFARRPSIVAFVAGMAVFALDSAIFLIAMDWIGVAFHLLALAFLWNGFSAARRLKS
ncbi:MAG TPA: hypothetical protein VEC06_04435 [Paucimonas sp.]|nr:hypothetical protein [Paucimonas sp.]